MEWENQRSSLRVHINFFACLHAYCSSYLYSPDSPDCVIPPKESQLSWSIPPVEPKAGEFYLSQDYEKGTSASFGQLAAKEHGIVLKFHVLYIA